MLSRNMDFCMRELVTLAIVVYQVAMCPLSGNHQLITFAYQI